MIDADKKLLNYSLLGFTTGIIIGIAGAISWHLETKRLPDSLLAEIKSLFLKESPIEGAWIESTPRIIAWRGQRRSVYFGGITREEDEGLVQYQYIFDAKTKELLDLKKENASEDNF